mgnify:CR=1 FL=1|tara:strand:+ start:97857 stop:98216 length:360 start_codon:yes stop_codon:yes gene_type:complete
MSQEKYLIHCNDGEDNLEGATISFLFATTAAKRCETVVLLVAGASQLCIKGGADGLVAEGMEPLSDLIDQYIGHGGKLWLCPVGAKIRGITEDDLIMNTEFGGATKAMAYMESGAKLLA